MANDNLPRGLTPIHLQPNGAHYYRVSTAADIFIGMPVQQAAAGYIVGVGTATGIANLMGVAIGFAGVNKSGIAMNAPFLDVSRVTPPEDGLESGDRFVLIADDPNQEFYVQEDTGGTALALADAGTAIDGIYRGASATAVNGDSNTGWANFEIDASSVVTTTGATFQVLRLHDGTNTDGTNNAVGDYAKWVVRILHHQRAGAAVAGPIV